MILKARHQQDMSEDEAATELRAWVSKQIGAIARPRDIHIVNELPKTRSGKIMRRLLRDIAEGRALGDTTTLTDTMVIDVISKSMLSGGSDD